MKYIPANRGTMLVLSGLILLLSSCNKRVAQAPVPAPPPAPAAQPAPAVARTSPPVVPRAASSTVPPAAPALTSQQMFQQMVRDAFFDYDKSDLRPDAKDALSRDADFLRAHPEIRFKIEGHCDERGGEEYNLALGDRRADSTKTYLVTMGVAADRIQTVSLGKEKPFCTSENEACYQQNRRGHFAMMQ